MEYIDRTTGKVGKGSTYRLVSVKGEEPKSISWEFSKYPKFAFSLFTPCLHIYVIFPLENENNQKPKHNFCSKLFGGSLAWKSEFQE